MNTAWSILKDSVEIVLAMSGIIVRRLTVLRMVSILGSFVFYYVVLLPNASLSWALWYFAFATVIHYVLLFGVFARNKERSWAQLLIRRYGEERGFLLYEAMMAFVFCHNGLSTGFVCTATANTGLEFIPTLLPLATAQQGYVLPVLGVCCSLIGFPVKVWATRVVGIDTYYYKDLFLRRPIAEFQVAGPYKWLDNPMYGVGHLHGYGVALVSGSLVGVLAVAFNQLCIWSFYFLIEKPHIIEVYGGEQPTGTATV